MGGKKGDVKARGPRARPGGVDLPIAEGGEVRGDDSTQRSLRGRDALSSECPCAGERRAYGPAHGSREATNHKPSTAPTGL
jgi:hypothetical protein